jgi:5-(carboxyamino)imidazole ribonucleotide synthase
VKYAGLSEIISWPGVHPHIYGKAHVKPFRKMGHVTVTAKKLDDARKLALKVKNTLRAIAK